MKSSKKVVSEVSGTKNIFALPREVLLLIFSQLNVEDLFAVIATNNKYIVGVATNNKLWQMKFKQYFPELVDKIVKVETEKNSGVANQNIDWYKYFRYIYKEKHGVKLIKETDRQKTIINLITKKLEEIKAAKRNPFHRLFSTPITLTFDEDGVQTRIRGIDLQADSASLDEKEKLLKHFLPKIQNNAKVMPKKIRKLYSLMHEDNVSELQKLYQDKYFTKEDLFYYSDRYGTHLWELAKTKSQKMKDFIYQIILNFFRKNNEENSAIDLNLNAYGIRLLYFAVVLNQKKYVQHLITNGDNINQHSDVFSKATPLHMASETNNKEMIETLLKLGANANEVDDTNQTPLMLVSTSEAAIPLINATLVNVKDKSGKTALDHAIEKKLFGVVELIINKPEVTQEQKDRSFITALRVGDVNTAKFLIEKGATPVTLFSLASNNANFNKIVKNKNSELNEYIYDIAKQFYLKNDGKVDVTKVDAAGKTLLHWAAMLNPQNINEIPTLVEQGAMVDAEDQTGLSPINTAIMLHQNEAAKKLITLNRTIDRESVFIPGIIKNAVKFNNREILEYVCIDQNAKNIGLFYAVANNNFELTKHLLSKGADPFTIIQHQNSFNEAVLIGNLEIVKLFLTQAKTKPSDFEIENAIEIANTHQFTEIAVMLTQMSLLSSLENYITELEIEIEEKRNHDQTESEPDLSSFSMFEDKNKNASVSDVEKVEAARALFKAIQNPALVKDAMAKYQKEFNTSPLNKMYQQALLIQPEQEKAVAAPKRK